MKDILGNEIQTGDTIVFAYKRGVNCATQLLKGKVNRVMKKMVEVQFKTNGTVGITNVHHEKICDISVFEQI